MKFGDLSKKLHDAVMSDDGEEAKNPTPTPAAGKPVPSSIPNFDFSKLSGAASAPATSFSSPSPFAVPGSAVLDEAVYQRVLAKTDFNTTAVGKVIFSYFEGLEGDDTSRFKSAMKLAAKRDGITPDQVLAAFDSLKSALQTESTKFSQAVDGQNQREVVGRQQSLQTISDNITKLNQQITDQQAQHTKISAELADAQGKIANATTQMQLATQRRASEIDTQKSQFTGLLR